MADAIAAAKAAFPAWSRSGIWERHVILKKTGDEIMARKDELGALLAREEGKTLPEAIGETIRAARSSNSSQAKCCALPARSSRRCVRMSASRSPATRSA
jgi:acyl-CoA reductase-like NAD-dependent aldehyde dehydrogenase